MSEQFDFAERSRPRVPVGPYRPATFGLPSNEPIHVEDRRQEEVPDDHEHDQTEGNDPTSESVTGPDRRPHDHRRGQTQQKPGCRILHVAEHESTVARRISV